MSRPGEGAAGGERVNPFHKRYTAEELELHRRRSAPFVGALGLSDYGDRPLKDRNGVPSEQLTVDHVAAVCLNPMVEFFKSLKTLSPDQQQASLADQRQAVLDNFVVLEEGGEA